MWSVVLFEPGSLLIPFPLFLWAGGPGVVFCMMLLLSSVRGSVPALCGLDLPSQSSSSSETYPLIEQADRSVCIPSLASRPCPHLLGLGWGLAQLPAMSRVSGFGRTRGWRLLVVPPASCRPDLAFVAHCQGDTRIMRNTCTSEDKQPGKSPDSRESEPECEGTGVRPASPKLAVLSFSA